MSELIKLVKAQANDEGLWFDAQTAAEAYLQHELRRLHAAVEALETEPVACGMVKSDGTLDYDLIGSESDVDYWLSEQQGGRKVKLYLTPPIQSEPVAKGFLVTWPNGTVEFCKRINPRYEEAGATIELCYAAPPLKEITDEEILLIMGVSEDACIGYKSMQIQKARAIIAAMKEKV